MKTRWENINADSGEKTWLTPKHIIDALGHFDTDPCCPPNMPWRTADRMLTKADDGTTAPWVGRVWLNPPYGREAYPFLERMSRYNGGGGHCPYLCAYGCEAMARLGIPFRGFGALPSRTASFLRRGRERGELVPDAFRAYRVFTSRHGRARQERTSRHACEVEVMAEGANPSDFATNCKEKFGYKPPKTLQKRYCFS